MRKSSSVFFIQFWQLCSLVPLFKQGNMGCPNSLIIGLLQGQKLHEKSDLSQLPPFTTQNSEIILTWPIDDVLFSLLCSVCRQKRTQFRWVCESNLPFFAVFEWASTWLHLEQHNSHSLLLRLRAWQVAIRPDDAGVAVVWLFLGCPLAKIDFFYLILLNKNLYRTPYFSFTQQLTVHGRSIGWQDLFNFWFYNFHLLKINFTRVVQGAVQFIESIERWLSIHEGTKTRKWRFFIEIWSSGGGLK